MVLSMQSLKNHNHSSDTNQEEIFDLINKIPRYQDAYVNLSESRCIFLSEVFTKRTSAEVCAWLIYYDRMNSTQPIYLYISSDGGDGAALTSIYDIMHMISAPVYTICLGKCYSAGAFILAAGAPGHRYIYPNGQVMLHGLQVVHPIIGDDQNNAKTYFEFLNTYNDQVLTLLAKHTKQPFKKLKEDCKRDLYFDAQEAVSYGLADFVLI